MTESALSRKIELLSTFPFVEHKLGLKQRRFYKVQCFFTIVTYFIEIIQWKKGKYRSSIFNLTERFFSLNRVHFEHFNMFFRVPLRLNAYSFAGKRTSVQYSTKCTRHEERFAHVVPRLRIESGGSLTNLMTSRIRFCQSIKRTFAIVGA